MQRQEQGSGHCKVVGYMSLNGKALLFSKSITASHGRALCQFYREQELRAVERLSSGIFDHLDEVLFGDLR